MFEHHLHEIRHAEMLRRSENERLAREVRDARPAARRAARRAARSSAVHAPEGRVSSQGRYARTA
ncbi:hypothetical protein ACIQMR_17530 [Streptomyces sp. NPDC091376]|uniref:hypothetical protein n=1 Tax=Streptomyces sp. NPDC091376 TaxID=3365994 RepID=UPI0037F217C4